MRVIYLFLATVMMFGCGGGGDNETNEQQGTSTAKAQFNGLYQSDDAVMIVDMDQQGQVIAYDSSNTIYSFDHVYTFSNELRLHGVQVTFDGGFEHFPDQVITVYFENDTAHAATIVNGQSFVHDFKRQPATLSLDDMVGTHTNQDTGETWAIESDGTFTVNAYCTLTGQLSIAENYYHSLTATASACPDSNFDGDYQGMVFSVIIQGEKFLAGAVYNDEGNYMWGYVPLP
ncbi:hypothetical protein [Photobacterium minamisatsumaniensis]|uniref:hypothetical protein n=1 Tax=Photobacterium minamisatsumaniensis TaxID=2910233 RepID=UPI003D10EFCA